MKKTLLKLLIIFSCLALFIGGVIFGIYKNSATEKEKGWYELCVNYADFIISYGTKTTVVSDGKIISNELGIVGMGAIGGDMDRYLEYGFVLPKLPKRSCYMVQSQSSDAMEYYWTNIYHPYSEDGIYVNIDADHGGKITVYDSGNVDTEYEAETKQTISITTNKMTTSWYNISVSGSDSGFHITMKSNQSIVIPNNENTIVDVEVSGNFNSLICEEISIPKKGIKVHEPKPGICEIRAVGGSVLQSAVYGCSVILSTRGDNNMETLKNIPIGSRLEEPEAPIREGYIFQGWYKEESCETLWDFGTDTVTVDMTLYAGWRPEEE